MAEVLRVNDARSAGLTDEDILTELRIINEELGNAYQVDSAFNAGISLEDISVELGNIRDNATTTPLDSNQPLQDSIISETSVSQQEDLTNNEIPVEQPEAPKISRNLNELLAKTNQKNEKYSFLFGDDLIRAVNEVPEINPVDAIALSGAETSFGKRLTSFTDVQGIMQVTNNTGKEEFKRNNIGREFNQKSTKDQFIAGSLHLKRHLETFNGDYEKAIGAYNAGEGAIKQAEKLAQQNNTNWIDELANTPIIKERNDKNKEIYKNKRKEELQEEHGSSLLLTDEDLLKGFTPKEKEITGLINRFKQNKEFLGEFEEEEISEAQMASFEKLMREGLPLSIETSIDKEKMFERAELEKKIFGTKSEEVRNRENAIKKLIIKQQEYLNQNPDVKKEVERLNQYDNSLATGMLGFVQGLDMVGGNIGNVVTALGSITNSETIQKIGDKIYDHYSLRPASLATPEILNRESGVDQWTKPAWWAHALGQQIPIIATMIGTGGLGGRGSAILGKKILGEKLTEAGLKGLTHYGMAISGGLTAGTFEGASLYRDMREAEFSEGEALLGGTLATGMSAALNSLGFSKILKALPNNTKGKLVGRLVGGGTEAVTEVLENPASLIAEDLAGKGRQYQNLTEDIIGSIKSSYEVGGPAFVMGLFLAGKIETRPDYDKVIAKKVKELEDAVGKESDFNEIMKKAGVAKWFTSPIETPLNEVLENENADQFVDEKSKEYFESVLENTKDVEGKDPKDLNELEQQQLFIRNNAIVELEKIENQAIENKRTANQKIIDDTQDLIGKNVDELTVEDLDRLKQRKEAEKSLSEIPGIPLEQEPTATQTEEATQEPITETPIEPVQEPIDTSTPLNETTEPIENTQSEQTPEVIVSDEVVASQQEEETTPSKRVENKYEELDEESKKDFKLKLKIQLRRDGRTKEEADIEAEELSKSTSPSVITLLNSYIKHIEIRGKERLETDDLTNLKNSRFLKAKDKDGNYINGKPIIVKNRKGEEKELFVPKDGNQLMFDIDDFGAFNKKYGQITGDEVLATVGALMNEHFGKIGTPVRIGGEELSVVFNPGVTIEQIQEADNNMREALTDIDIKGEKITYSAGVANTFEKANEGERQAKAEGKNKTIIGELDGREQPKSNQKVTKGIASKSDTKSVSKTKQKTTTERKPESKPKQKQSLKLKRLGNELKAVKEDLKVAEKNKDQKETKILKKQEQDILNAVKIEGRKRTLESQRLKDLRKELKQVDNNLKSKKIEKEEKKILETRQNALINSIKKEEDEIAKNFKFYGLPFPIDIQTGIKTQKAVKRTELKIDRKGDKRISDEEIAEALVNKKTKSETEALIEDKEINKVTSEIDKQQSALNKKIESVKKVIENKIKSIRNTINNVNDINTFKRFNNQLKVLEDRLVKLKEERKQKFIEDPFQDKVEEMEIEGIKLVQEIRGLKSQIRRINPNRPSNELFDLKEKLIKLEDKKIEEDETLSRFINEKNPESEVDIVLGSSPSNVLTKSELRQKAFEAEKNATLLNDEIANLHKILKNTKDKTEKESIKNRINYLYDRLNWASYEAKRYREGVNPSLNDYMESAPLISPQRLNKLNKQRGAVHIPSVNDGIAILEKFMDRTGNVGKGTWQFLKTSLGGNIKAQKLIGVEFQRLNNKRRSLEFLAQTEILKITDNLTEQEAELIPFFIEKTNVPKELNRPDLIELSKQYKKDPEFKKRIDKTVADVNKYFGTMYEFMKNADKKFTAKQIEDYVTHIWSVPKKDLEKAVKWIGNKSDTENPFSKERIFKTYAEGIQKGFIPKNLSVANIMDVHAKYAIRTVANQQFIELLKSIDTGKNPLIILESEAFDKKGDIKPEYRRYKKLTNNNFAELRTVVDPDGKVSKRVDHYLYNRDIEAAVKTVFETFEPGPIFNFFRSINAYFKTINLSWSLFHHNALIETAVATIGLKNTMKIVSDMNTMLNSIENKNYVALRNIDLSSDFINHGGQLGSIIDADVPIIDKGLNAVKDWAGRNKVPVKKLVETFQVANDTNNKILWDWLHNALKIAAYEHIVKNEIETNSKIKGLDNEQLAKMNAAQFVNDTFGGQVWENLMFSPKTIAWANQLILSPDWLISTLRQALSVTGLGTVAQSNVGKKLRRKMGAKFWIRAGVYFGIGANLLNITMRAWDEEKQEEKKKEKLRESLKKLRANIKAIEGFKGVSYTKEREEYKSKIEDIQEKLKSNNKVGFSNIINEPWKYTMFHNSQGHRTHIFTGRYSDGTERYLRFGKQFRELPEFFYSFDHEEIRPIRSFTKKSLGKLSPIFGIAPTIMIQQTFNGFPDMDLKRAKEESDAFEYMYSITKGLTQLSAPFVIQGLMNDYKEFTWTDLFAQSSKGMTLHSAKNFTIKSILNNDKNLHRVIEGMHRNNIDYVKVIESAKNEIIKRSKEDAKKSAKTDLDKKPKTLGESIEKIEEKSRRKTAEVLNAIPNHKELALKLFENAKKEIEIIRKQYEETPAPVDLAQ